MADTEVIIHLYEETRQLIVSGNSVGDVSVSPSGTRRSGGSSSRGDRVGIKPLYYCQTGQAFYFASEFKAILAAPWDGAAGSLSFPGGDPGSSFRFIYVAGGKTRVFESIKEAAAGPQRHD